MFDDVLSIVCLVATVSVITFIVGRVWMHSVDAFFSGLKKLLGIIGIKKKDHDHNWRTLEEIRKKDSQK